MKLGVVKMKCFDMDAWSDGCSLFFLWSGYHGTLFINVGSSASGFDDDVVLQYLMSYL